MYKLKLFGDIHSRRPNSKTGGFVRWLVYFILVYTSYIGVYIYSYRFIGIYIIFYGTFRAHGWGCFAAFDHMILKVALHTKLNKQRNVSCFNPVIQLRVNLLLDWGCLLSNFDFVYQFEV